jgi:hypothetical protein
MIKGNVLFHLLNPRRIYEGKNRNKCMPEIPGEKVHPPGTGKTLTLRGLRPAAMAPWFEIMFSNPDRDFR